MNRRTFIQNKLTRNGVDLQNSTFGNIESTFTPEQV